MEPATYFWLNPSYHTAWLQLIFYWMQSRRNSSCRVSYALISERNLTLSARKNLSTILPMSLFRGDSPPTTSSTCTRSWVYDISLQRFATRLSKLASGRWCRNDVARLKPCVLWREEQGKWWGTVKINLGEMNGKRRPDFLETLIPRSACCIIASRLSSDITVGANV